MRLALLSDLHGNIVALEAVLAHLARQGSFDRVVVAGDIAWAGPRPAEVVDRLREIGAEVIQGNTDAFFSLTPDEAPPGKRSDRFADHLQWMKDQLGPERVAYLANLPFSHVVTPEPGQDLLVVHANPVDMERPLRPMMSTAELDEILLETGEPHWAALAFGHLHIPFTMRWRERLLVDVASAGLPMDGDHRAAYAVLTWEEGVWHATHHRVYYDVPVVAHEMRTNGMPRGRHFAQRLARATYET